jgi:hypothetical protein
MTPFHKKPGRAEALKELEQKLAEDDAKLAG